MTKKEIRSYQKELRNQLSDEERKSFSNSIHRTLYQTKEYHNCKRLFIFVSFQSEVDTLQIIEHALLQGKNVYIPKVEKDIMEFYKIDSLNNLTPSKFGVAEPLGEEKYKYITATDNLHNNLILLPGLAFDSNGNRIGYGGGYYDKYLQLHAEVEFNKIALAYDFQVMENIPFEEFDEKADAIITPTQMILCRNKENGKEE